MWRKWTIKFETYLLDIVSLSLFVAPSLITSHIKQSLISLLVCITNQKKMSINLTFNVRERSDTLYLDVPIQEKGRLNVSLTSFDFSERDSREFLKFKHTFLFKYILLKIFGGEKSESLTNSISLSIKIFSQLSWKEKKKKFNQKYIFLKIHTEFLHF